MKKISVLLATITLLFCSPKANAQYYELANQLPSLLSPALSGSLNYKGYVDFSGMAGLGDNRANFIEISTSQGFKYSSWFFMGVGIGVDVAMAHQPELLSDIPGDDAGGYYGYGSSKTKMMIPIFTDFRFNIGADETTSFFVDLKLGAAWIMGSSYLRLNRGYLSNQTQFYLKPTMGIRIPINSKNSRQAVNIGVSYQLLTSNNNYGWRSRSLSLNNIGATVGFEW